MRRSLRNRLRTLKTSVNSLIREVRAQYFFGSSLEQYASDKSELLLHIGSGPRVIPGWINLDITPISGEVYYFDAINPLPLANGTAKRIHCEHFLEHIEFDEAERFLAECYRVLEAGGTMRIIVPDLEKYIVAYTNNDTIFFNELKGIGNPTKPLETKALICNQMFRMGGDHRFAWDFETLYSTCRHVGFSQVQRSAWNEGPPTYRVDGQDSWRPLESVYCEVVK